MHTLTQFMLQHGYLIVFAGVLAEQLGLTSREAEVLLWISRGKQNRQMSKILRISPRTVNKHVEQIFKKLDVDNRASATAIAVSTLKG